MDKNPYSGPEWDQLVRSVIEELVPKMNASALVVSLFPDDMEADVKYALELGYSIMLDKPIILIAHPDAVVPDKLLRVADSVCRVDFSNPEIADHDIKAAIDKYFLEEEAVP